jgi:phage-related protein
VVGDAVGWIKDLVARFKEGGAGMEETGSQISTMIGQLKDVFSSAFEAIKAIVSTAIDFLKGIWRVFGDDLMAFAREFWATIQETFRGAMEVLGGIFDLIKSLLTGKWGEAWDALKKIVDGVWDTIFSVVRGAVTNVIPTIISGAGQVISSAARTAFDGLKEVFKGVLNWIIDRWNGLDFKVPEFGIGPAKFGGYTIGLPEIPRFHQGGVVPGPPGSDVLGVLRAGERVLPAGMGGVVVNLTVNGWVGDDVALTRKIIAALNAEARRSGSLVA